MKTWENGAKQGLGEGPWSTEPDKAHWVDTETGLDCLIVRVPGLGTLCGYVGVPKGHPWYRREYDDVPASCHGGLTFSDSCQSHKDESVGVCHPESDAAHSDVWWIGFDCGHLGDYVPGMFAPGMPPMPFTFSGSVQRSYKDFAYVRGECTALAAQVGAAA